MLGIPLKYNLRHLAVRWVGTSMTALGIAIPTGVFCAVLALSNGLNTALQETGDAQTIVFLRKSALTETNSSVAKEDARQIETLEGIAKDPKTGRALVSSEVMVLLNMPRLGGIGASNVAIRGTSEVGRLLRPDVRLVQGEWPAEGSYQVAVAKNISTRFEGCTIGSRLPLGKRDWRVVGIFDAGASAYGSEIWGDANTLADAFLRSAWNGVWVRVQDDTVMSAREWQSNGALPSGTEDAESKLEEMGLVAASRVSATGLRLLNAPRNDNTLKTLDAFTERDYFRKQTEFGSPISAIGAFIAVFMAVGAAFAIMNTMYAAIASRSREIAVLRALGFPRRSILASFVVESILLAFLGGVLGSIASLVFNGYTTGTTNFATFSEIAFAFRVDFGVMLRGFLFGAILGAVGGLLPAIRASRQPIVTAMRAI